MATSTRALEIGIYFKSAALFGRLAKQRFPRRPLQAENAAGFAFIWNGGRSATRVFAKSRVRRRRVSHSPRASLGFKLYPNNPNVWHI
jgi:hypothetical protein